MLKVSLHHAAPERVSPCNVLGRLDIGYARLDATADYKAVLFCCGLGEQTPVQLKGYPRWSASVWDLVARTVCLSLYRREAVWPAELPLERKGAFIDDLTAVIEHWPDGFETRRATIATAHVAMWRRRCHYTATFQDDLTGQRESTVFLHSPKGLSPWDLLVRAYCWTAHESFELPPRPSLYTPIPVEEAGQSFVSLDTVSEPARTGITRWMTRKGMPAATVPFLAGPCVAEADFVKFLRFAV